MVQAVARADLALVATGPAKGEVRFAAMGNTAHVMLIADDDAKVSSLINAARGCAARLEAAWSRFIPTSDVYRLNTARGRAVRISSDTEVLIRHLLAAFDATDGLFDPFVLPALVNAGYSVSMSDDGGRSCAAAAPTGQPCSASVYLESVEGETWCRLLDGATIDPGGLGKGLAADIIAERLMLEGALGVLVSMGGDIRCIGDSPNPAGWVIDIETQCHPVFGSTTIVMKSGAIATSSTHAKRWHGGHHVIDPSTMLPTNETAAFALRQSSVIASTAVWAEVFATATLVAGSSTAGLIVEARGLAARFERVDGRPLLTNGFERYAR